MYFRKKFDSRSIKSLLHAFGIKSTYFIKKKKTLLKTLKMLNYTLPKSIEIVLQK